MSRPVFLNLFQIKFPVTAIVSILHRISGVAVFFGMPFLIFWLYLVTSSETSFAHYEIYSQIIWVKIIYFLIVAGLSYHILAGVRHLYHDFSHDHSLVSTRISAWLTLLFAIIVVFLLLFRIFF